MVLRFMNNKKDDAYYIKKCLEHIKSVIKYTKGKTYEEIMSDEQLIDATLFRLIQLIENIKNISIEFKEKHSEIPWGNIMGFRNGIVHEYGRTNYTTVYEIVSSSIYQLKEVFENASN